MPLAPNITTVAHVIQLAVAPVFLLTGVGAILGVLVNRLARVVDRFRLLENHLLSAVEDQHTPVKKKEMAILARRARLIHWAISLCTVCALLICLVVATLFIGSVRSVDVSDVIAILFIAAMGSLILGLLSFLREIYLATGNIHIGKR